jgi:F0F1-type ATP synthase assembly protein I
MTDRDRRAPIVERAKWFQLTEAASVGIEMAAAIGVGAGLGIWLERNVTHWSPWTTYIGLGIGLGAAVIAVVRTARNFTRVIAAEEEAERRAQGLGRAADVDATDGRSARPGDPTASAAPGGGAAQAHGLTEVRDEGRDP